MATSSSLPPPLWGQVDRMDNESSASSSRAGASAAASASAIPSFLASSGGSPSRSCLTLPITLRRTGGSTLSAGSKQHFNATPTSAESTPIFRSSKKRSSKDKKQKRKQSGGGGGASSLNGSSTNDPYDMSWEFFPYDYNNNYKTTAATAAGAAVPTPTNTTATTAAMSMSPPSFAETSLPWNFVATSRSSPAITPGRATRTSAAAPPSTTSSTSSSSSHYSANSSPAAGQYNPTTTTTATSPSSSSRRTPVNFEHLLTPPTPQDRASVARRRQAYEQEQRQLKQQQRIRGLYDGEIEPEGIRGQEADVVASPITPSRTPSFVPSGTLSATSSAASSSSSFPAIRTFSNNNNGGGPINLILPAVGSRSYASLSAIPEVDSNSLPSASSEQQARNSTGGLVISKVASPSSPASTSGSADRNISISTESDNNNSVDDVNGARGGITPIAAAAAVGEPDTSSSSKESSTSISSPEMYREFMASKEKQDHQQQQQQQQQRGLARIAASTSPAAPMQFQTTTGQAVRGYGVASVDHDDDNGDDDDNDSDSTQSDDELRQMQADFIPTAATATTSPSLRIVKGQQQQHRLASPPSHGQHERLGNNELRMMKQERPSPVAAAAAATAARTVATQQKPVLQMKMSASPSLSSSRQFWISHRPSSSQHSNNSHNHSREEGMSHADVNVVRTATIDDDYNEASSISSIDALNLLAMEYVNRNEFGDAIATFMQVLKRQQEHYGDISPAVASAWHNLGTVYAKRVAALQRQLEEQQLQLSTPNTIGTAPTPVVQLELEQRTARQAALEAFQAAARTARDSLSSTHPNVAVSLVRIGFLLLQSRQYQNAVITFEEALRIRLHSYGPKHALVANLYNNLGVCHMHLGNFKQGRQSLLEGLTIQRQLVRGGSAVNRSEQNSDRHSDNEGQRQWVRWMELADTLFNLGGLCLEWIRKQGPDLRRVEEAESSFSEALQIRTRVLGPDDPSVIQLREMLLMAKSIPRPHPRSLSPRPPFSSPSSHRTRAPRNLESAKPGQTSSTSYGYKPTTTRKGTGTMISGSRNNQSLMTADDTADFSAPESPSRLANKTIIPDDHSLEVSRIMNSDANPQSEDASWNNHHHVGREAIGARGVAKGTNKGVFPPVSEVRVSKEKEEEDYATLDQPNRSYSSETRIYIAPHLVPDSPTKRRQKDDSQIVVTGHSLDETLDLDSSGEILDGNRSQLVGSFSYDAEESCMINDVGVDSEHGRVHFPLAWTKHDGSLAATACRDIVVTRPFRIAGRESEKTVKAADLSFSTGNESRDDVMARARALLDAHGQSVKGWNPSDSEVDSEGEGEGLYDTRNDVYDEDLLLEDGLAPLGGSWSMSRESWEEPKAVTELLGDPMNHLPDIHQVASKQLLANNFVDSLPLFSIILRCQRRRNGPVHADVASALHNVGICQLRANNHDEALQAFEESARIRKGSLGRDHPFVAVSLVKVGITLLLLHRFEDALWSFREALSVRKHALGPLHPSTARIYNNIGCVHVEFNEFREARRAFEAALDIQRNAICHDPDSGPLLFAAATTLCNLGYLYRYRDLHEKAALVLKEAWEMQETVLGQSHATVLSTLDNLADSCGNCGQTPEALRFYNIVLKRFRVGGRTESQKVLHAEAVLLYKMSRVHRQRDDHVSQLDSLKLALRSIRAYSDTASVNGIRPDTLERRILYDIRACREQIEKDELNWV